MSEDATTTETPQTTVISPESWYTRKFPNGMQDVFDSYGSKIDQLPGMSYMKGLAPPSSSSATTMCFTLDFSALEQYHIQPTSVCVPDIAVLMLRGIIMLEVALISFRKLR